MPKRTRKGKKIAVITWLINDIGGITTWTDNFIKGCKTLGHNVQMFYSTGQRSLSCHPTERVFRSPKFHLIPSKHLPFRKDMIEDSIKELNEFDIIVFSNPCPHKTKAHMKTDNPYGWKRFYEEVTASKVAVFHDSQWFKHKAWIKEVVDDIDVVIAAQHMFADTLDTLVEDTNLKINWEYFPLLLPELPKVKKERFVTLATQWLAIKNHRHLIPKLPDVKIPVHTYGTGQVYYKFDLEGLIKKGFKEDKYRGNKYKTKVPHIHHGYVDYKHVIESMRKGWFSLDLSTRGMTNMTHWEPLTQGSISLITNETMNSGTCEIPKDCCIPFELSDVNNFLNSLLDVSSKKLSSIARRGNEFVRCCDHVQVAKRILEKV